MTAYKNDTVSALTQERCLNLLHLLFLVLDSFHPELNKATLLEERYSAAYYLLVPVGDILIVLHLFYLRERLVAILVHVGSLL